jgi:hypothetical protein
MIIGEKILENLRYEDTGIKLDYFPFAIKLGGDWYVKVLGSFLVWDIAIKIRKGRNPKRSDRDQNFLIATRSSRISIQNGLRSGVGSKQSPTLKFLNYS